MFNGFKYTDTEIKEILSSMVIIVDSREQVNSHITDWFDKKKIAYVIKKLDFADYSCFIPSNEKLSIPRDIYFDKSIAIERKGSLDELIGNFSERDRIQDEFLRSTGKIHLVIEDAEYSDIYDGNYKSKYASKSATGTLHSMSDKYGFNFIFLNKEYTAKYIFCTLYYHIRNIIKSL